MRQDRDLRGAALVDRRRANNAQRTIEQPLGVFVGARGRE